MDTLESLLFGLFTNDRNDVVGNDKVDGYTIDTCYTTDEGYETGIMRDGGEWIIVERYPSREAAEEGHKKWMETFCMAAPSSAYSVQLDRVVRF